MDCGDYRPLSALCLNRAAVLVRIVWVHSDIESGMCFPILRQSNHMILLAVHRHLSQNTVLGASADEAGM